jgi:hypothetical protein
MRHRDVVDCTRSASAHTESDNGGTGRSSSQYRPGRWRPVKSKRINGDLGAEAAPRLASSGRRARTTCGVVLPGEPGTAPRTNRLATMRRRLSELERTSENSNDDVEVMGGRRRPLCTRPTGRSRDPSIVS